MQAFRDRPVHIPAQPYPAPSQGAIGLVTPPVLGLILSSRILSEALIWLGQQSEEVFRGDRLPSLPLMNPDEAP